MTLAETITGLQHIGIPTNDIKKTIAFYESLGFTLVYKTRNEAAQEDVAFLQLNNLMIETYENGQCSKLQGAIDHIALDVLDIDEVFDALKAGGYTLLTPNPISLPFWEHGIRYLIIEGVNHEKIEFAQRL